MVFVRAGVCMWVCVCLQGSLRSWMMAERKLLGMRLPHFVYPTLELDPDPHVENFLRPTLFFWNPAEQLRSDIL